MEILLYQIGIFIIIQVASFFGKKARNIAIFIFVIFSLIQIFMLWLFVIQSITIGVSYIVSNSLFFNSDNQDNHSETKQSETKSSSKVTIESYENNMRVYREYDENDNLSPEIREKIENKKKIDKTLQDMYDNDPEYRKMMNDYMKNMFKNK